IYILLYIYLTKQFKMKNIDHFLNYKKPLVILEIANNHMGDLSHAKNIIDKYFNIIKKYKRNLQFAVKFQFRDIKTYIHKDYLKKPNHKYVARFFDTQLNESEWKRLIKYAKRKFLIICTPFDEVSVKNIVKYNFDFLKIASCSMDEWPLLEYIAKFAKKKKIIASLGGGDEQSIRNIISFFSSEKRKLNAKFLYCVAKYPTEPENLNLSYFLHLRKIYGDKLLGFSTHERTDETLSASIAYAMGARIFEKHVAIETKKYKKNAYSVDILQFERWLENLNNTILRFGSVKNREIFLNKEKKNLLVFKRGVFLKSGTYKKKNSKLHEKDYYFAFPAKKGQLLSNDISKFKEFEFINSKPVTGAVKKKDLIVISKRIKVEEIRDKINELIEISNVIVAKNTKLEISHHYGLEKFYQYGLTMTTIHNSKYCKKLLFLLPKQIHPEQYHKIKQETFFVLYGKIKLEITENKIKKTKFLSEGDIYTIKAGAIHKFNCISKIGAVIEELSTTHAKADSFYVDEKITKNKFRKTFVSLN
ncbi:N-acetylneuraminate synthase family protein, partial [Candidatus Pelagibacter sp.]|uniref:N-acetylneuraminate synthase family protein n=1 Tax=Candidatus Pelagibacter sp. TaxID=2024849 RepID=UPI003F85B7FC